MKNIKKVLVIGSGALKIGQAGEFDYSGSQALKAIKEEGIKTVLINPNIATIQTSQKLADKIYFLPVTTEFITRIIKKEQPDGVLLGFGGQTALNCGLDLAQKGIFAKYKVKVLGTQIKAIKDTEDRQLFIKRLKEIGLQTPKSRLAKNLKQACQAADIIGFPLLIRVGYALGGFGSALVKTRKHFKKAVEKALSNSSQVLIEEYLGGWKEIEYEVVRDKFDNCLTICNMENFDPMGIHTGESIVVAPSQTLSNFEYHFLREVAIKFIRHLKIVGECNIQFAVNPKKFSYRIIEVNARLSRSSALASKATGYPLAFIAAKLALGKSLGEIKNNITKATSAFFEPALDYIIVKFPRWDLEKFMKVNQEIGSEMKSVGEVMAISRNLPEALQKSIRMLGQNWQGLINEITLSFLSLSEKELLKQLQKPTTKRIFIVTAALLKNISVEKINKTTGIDPFFLKQIRMITEFYLKIKNTKKITNKTLLQAKLLGFSDQQLAEIHKVKIKKIEDLRERYKLNPKIKKIDTLAAEFPAKANYQYLTYQADKSDMSKKGQQKRKAIILGSGPYCIGSSVEFDWCAVNAALALKKHGLETIMVNCNPETVSTDYDICSKLYFEELSLERILDICQNEKPEFVILSFGGQIANNLAMDLHKHKIKILGTSPVFIDKAEDRKKFSLILDKLKVKQPEWNSFVSENQAVLFAKKIGYSVLVRPSYVLSGAAMFVAYAPAELRTYLKRSIKISKKYPLVISKFIEEAKEIEVDGVARKGDLVLYTIGEHIEEAGVHSGDATIVLPAQHVYIQTLRRIKNITRKIIKALNITGPFNIQFLAKDEEIMVIECNLRASRSFPFASKVIGVNFVEVAIEAMLGKKNDYSFNTLDLDYVGVKSPQFSFTRLAGADPILRVEMASTGESACLGENLLEAYLKSLLSVDFKLPKKNILLTLGGMYNKMNFLNSARKLKNMGFNIFATENTYLYLQKNQIVSKMVYKHYEFKSPNVIDLIQQKKVDLVINLSQNPDKEVDVDSKTLKKQETDGYLIRRAAIDFGASLLTNLKKANLFVQAMERYSLDKLKVKSWQSYTKKTF